MIVKFLTRIAPIILFGTILLSSQAFAGETEKCRSVSPSTLDIVLKGYFEFEAGFRNQSKINDKDKKVSHNRDTFAFYNRSAVYLKGENVLDSGVTYGAKIVLVPTSTRKSGGEYNGSHLYIVTDYGKFEGGSPIDSSSQMGIGAGSITASSGPWSRYANKSPSIFKFQGASPSVATMSEFWLDGKLSSNIENRKYSDEPSRAISYYTPKFELTPTTKLQIGVTFTPDSSNTGAGSITEQSSGIDKHKISLDGKETFDIDRTSKDVFSGGIVIEQHITDGVDIKIGATGETGKSAGKAVRKKGDDKIAEFTLSDLKSYQIGAVVTLGNFSVAGNYGSLGKSLTTKEYHKTGRNTDYYEGALAYKQGPFKTSVKYFKSEQFKNEVDAVTVATDFSLVPGLKPYAAISTFNVKAKPEFYPEAEKKKTRGTVGMLGAKLSL